MFDPENVVNMDVDKDKEERVDKNMGMVVNMDMVDKILCSVGPGILVPHGLGKCPPLYNFLSSYILSGLYFPSPFLYPKYKYTA